MYFSFKGKPISQTRHRHTKSGHTYDPRHEDKKTIATLAKAQMQSREFTIFDHQPLVFTLYITRKFPKSYSNKKIEKLWDTGRPDVCKPDVDNYLKFYMDALNGIAYKDDAQIVSAQIFKQFAETDEAFIEIKEF